ncbi:MAG: ABC transporter permease [Caldilineales bacterium]|nr:ABC transporter permease [Caldilineales bacterium]MDW8317833.1 ABC transporter permease [Anaerolineae bacterium]
MENRQRLTILMVPPGLWLLLLFLVPLGVMALYSFRPAAPDAHAARLTLDNYREFFANTAYQRLLLRSLWIASLVAAVSVVLAYPLAYFLAFRAGPWRVTLLTILIVPAWTSYLLRILSWRLILGSNGILNSALISLGLREEAAPILLYSQAAVTVTLIYVWIPFVALPIFASLERINKSLLEAAADLGCPPWQAFLRVTLPLSMPGVLAGFFFAFIPTVGEYVTPLLVGGSQGIMYGNVIQDQFLRGLNWPLGSAMSLVMLVVVFVLMAIALRFVRLRELVEV